MDAARGPALRAPAHPSAIELGGGLSAALGGPLIFLQAAVIVPGFLACLILLIPFVVLAAAIALPFAVLAALWHLASWALRR